MSDRASFDCATNTITIEPIPAAEDGQVGDEFAWLALRAERDGRLTASDWTQIGDTELTDVEVDAWAAYRQELRDLPENTTDPAAPDWPEPPA